MKRPGLAAATCAAAFWFAGYALLARGHPFEDAYILFRYVDNLAAGHGMVFFAGGPRTEGAVDFLWILLLWGPVAFGVDVALAAVAVGGAAVGAAAWLLAREAQGRGHPWLAWLACAWALTFHGSLAALGGFGTAAFSAAILASAVLLHRGGSRWLPLLALSIALLRPEGTVPAALLTVQGALLARKHGRLRPYLRLTGAALLLGVLYLAWHLWYFGHLLPLPVRVKGSWDLPGLAKNLAWLHREFGPLPLLAATAWLLWRGAPGAARRLAFAALPALSLLLPLCFAEQLQNAHWRFQAPVTLTLAWVAWRAWLDAPRRRVHAAVIALALLPSIALGLRKGTELVASPTRLHTWCFAPRLGALLGPDDTLALTEAGILAYYSRSRVVDLLGLNDARFAGTPPTPDDLADLRPAALTFNAYGNLGGGALAADSPAGRPGPLQLGAADLALAPTPSGGVAAPAARACIAFLARTRDYRVLAVPEGRNLLVYAFRKDHPRTRDLGAALAECCGRQRRPSYLEVERER